MKIIREQTPYILLAIAITCSLVVFINMDTIPQNNNYHHFANENTIWRIPNFWNVFSNIGFIISGIYGINLIKKNKITNPITWALFSGLMLTGLGSAYYHYQPNNQTLVWDRLPMTIVFTSFFSLIYQWYFTSKTALRIWFISFQIGIASVLYWQYTESIQQGDLRLYALVQFLPLLLIPVITIIHYNKNQHLWKPIGITLILYIIAKFLEHYDYSFYEITNYISGHPIKHVFSAIATFSMVLIVKKQTIMAI